MQRLLHRNAVVTGAASGIGQGIAIRLAREGANVALNYVGDRARAEAALTLVREAQAPGAKAIIIQADVSNEEQVEAMFAEAIGALGGLDILVNNAGIQKAAESHETATEDFDRVVSVNLRGTYLCARAAIRHFLDQSRRGVVLNNSSVHEIIPKPKYLSYSVPKGAIENLTKTLALEYAGRGIRVNAVGPGAIATPINRAWIDDEEKRREVESHIPMGRAGTVEEIAAVFAFLASDDASYITGQTIFACGGLTLYPEFRGTWASGE